jgi:biotin carboxyl carrier protein
MRRYTLEIRGRNFIVDVHQLAPNRFEVVVADESYEVTLTGDENLPAAAITPAFQPARAAGTPRAASAAQVAAPAKSMLTAAIPTAAIATEPRTLTAPMPGVILQVDVRPGDSVAHGQQVVILEAMKMKNSIRLPRGGTVVDVCVVAGQAVAHGDPILRYKER